MRDFTENRKEPPAMTGHPCKAASPGRSLGTVAKGEPLEARQVNPVPSLEFLVVPASERNQNVPLQRN